MTFIQSLVDVTKNHFVYNMKSTFNAVVILCLFVIIIKPSVCCEQHEVQNSVHANNDNVSHLHDISSISTSVVPTRQFYITSDDLVSTVQWTNGLINRGEWLAKLLQTNFNSPRLAGRSCWYASQSEMIIWHFRDQTVLQKGGGALQITMELSRKYVRASDERWVSTIPSNITFGALYFCNNAAFDEERSWLAYFNNGRRGPFSVTIPGCMERVPLARWLSNESYSVGNDVKITVPNLRQPLDASIALHTKLLAEFEPVYFYLAFQINPDSTEIGLCDLHMYTFVLASE